MMLQEASGQLSQAHSGELFLREGLRCSQCEKRAHGTWIVFAILHFSQSWIQGAY